MDNNKSITDLLSRLIPGDQGGSAGQDQPGGLLAESLKGLAGQAGGPLQAAVAEFLNGQGELHDATRVAVASKGSSASSDVIKMLASKFGLSPAIANVIGPLLVKLIPSIGKQAAKDETPPKKKTQRKTKPKTSSSAKSEASSSRKKPKKTSASKPAAGKKPSSSSKKTSSSSAKPKTARRSISVDIGEGGGEGT